MVIPVVQHEHVQALILTQIGLVPFKTFPLFSIVTLSGTWTRDELLVDRGFREWIDYSNAT